MKIRPDQNNKGLWLPDEARAAGAHALIIGISDYPYLADGSAPDAQRAPDNSGLGQLEVCAKTAAKVFKWLGSAGEVAGAPLATCRLLLAPRRDERAEVDELTGGAYGSADFTTVRAATEAWADSILAGGTEADINVAFFCFSGHGTEYMGSPALLTSDILNPRSAGASHKAIGFLSLCQAVKTYGIDRALFFVDACRDAPGVAQKLHIVGDEILKPFAYPPKSHEALICLQSTRSGGSAYQVPGDQATIFGQAVLDALEGPPPSHQPYNTAAVPWQLVFKNLESHVKERVIQLLKPLTATLIQSVVPYGDPYYGDMLVAEKVGPQPGEDVRRGPPPALETGMAARSDEILKGFKIFHASEETFWRARAHGELADHSIMEEIFGHESITDPWIQTLKILDAETAQPVPVGTVRLMQASSQQIGGTLTTWMDVIVTPRHNKAVWIGAGLADDDPSFSVAIPRDFFTDFPVRLDIAFRETGPFKWKIMAMSARIGDPSVLDYPGFEKLPVWSALWDIQRREIFSNLEAAGRAARDVADLERVLQDKTQSPVAAMIAATFLIRCGPLDQLHDWPRNLANWFEWLPDGALLWAETLLRRDDIIRSQHQTARSTATGYYEKRVPRDDAAEVRRLVGEPAYEEARIYFSKLADRGPPLLAANLTMAVRQMSFWKRVLETKAVTEQAYFDLKDACAVVERAAEFATSDGLFTGFASRAGALAPHEVLGVRRRKASPSERRAAA